MKKKPFIFFKRESALSKIIDQRELKIYFKIRCGTSNVSLCADKTIKFPSF